MRRILATLLIACLLPLSAAISAEALTEDAFALTTSHVVHYTEDTEGTAEVTASADASAYRVDFEISNGDTVWRTERDVPFAQGKASLQYNPSGLEKKVQYKLSVSVHETGGTEIKRWERAIMRFDRPTAIDENGTYIMNGKEFKPVIGYHVNVTDTDYARAKEAGINVVQMAFGACAIRSNPDGVVEALEMLEKYDLYGLFCPYLNMKPAGNATNLANTKLLAKTLKNHPRVFGWALMDEPFGGNEPPTEEQYADMATSYYAIRYEDDTHPAYICDYTPERYAQDVQYCDVFAPDIYSRSQTIIQNYTSRAVLAAGKKPVYSIIRTYGLSDATMPLGYEIQHYVYQALAGGARGHGYFSFSDSINENDMITPLYTMENRWPSVLAVQADLPVLHTVFSPDYTEEIGEGYYKRTWGNGICMLLSTGNGTQYTQTCGAGENIEFIAGDVLHTTAGNGNVTIELPQWTATIYKLTAFDNTGILFRQNEQYVSRIKGGTVRAVCQGYTDATIYLQLIQLTEDGEKVIKITCDGTCDIPRDNNAYTLVAYAWNTRGGMRPLCKRAVTGNASERVGL